MELEVWGSGQRAVPKGRHSEISNFVCIRTKLYVAVFEHHLSFNELSNEVLHRVPSVQRQKLALGHLYLY